MTERVEFQLLGELAKLLRKYGPEPFERLAKTITSEEMARHLAALLTKAAEAGRLAELKGGRRGGVESEVDRLLSELRARDQTKFNLLNPIRSQLESKTLLPAMRDIREAVEATGIPSGSNQPRNRLIAKLISHLALLPADEIERKLTLLRDRYPSDRSLAAWSGVILRETPTQKK
jgi:hypothetical protein